MWTGFYRGSEPAQGELSAGEHGKPRLPQPQADHVNNSEDFYKKLLVILQLESDMSDSQRHNLIKPISEHDNKAEVLISDNHIVDVIKNSQF